MANMLENIEKYRRHMFFKYVFIVICLIIAVAVAFYSLSVGAYPVTFEDIIRVISDRLNGDIPPLDDHRWFADDVVFNIRLPRILFAVVAGVGLAVSGVAMQSIMKNPLAEPYTTGVSSGAYLGVALFMAYGTALTSSGLVSNAIIFALIPVGFILLLSPKMNNSVATLILIGTAITYMFNAASTLILVSSDSETVANVYRWQVGSFSNLGWDALSVAGSVVVVGTVIMMCLSKKLNVMMLGDESAKSLGLDVKRLRLLCLVVMAVMVASVVAYAGILGFVGLICPHMIRLILGSDNRLVIPAACSFGAAFLVIADTLARVLSDFDIIPVGAIASLIGAPIFLYILIRNKRGIW